MKRYLVLVVLLLFVTDTVAQQTDELVDRIVRQNALVQAGERVYVIGGNHVLPLMEDISEACRLVGATAFPVVPNSCKLGFLNRSDLYQSLTNAHVWIIVDPLVEDPDSLRRNITDDELILLSKTEYEICTEAVKHNVRILRVWHPSEKVAERLKVEDLQKMVLKACIYEDGVAKFVPQYVTRLKSLLSRANVVRIKTSSGTNFSCLINNRPILLNDGKLTEKDVVSPSVFDKQASLPAWAVEVSVLETSANGKVVIPRAKCDDHEMTGVTFNFVKGKVENFAAAKGGECFKNKLASREGPKDLLGSLLFGFNPELRIIANDSVFFCPKGGAGIIWLTLGGNVHLGGKNPLSCGQFSFPLVDVTVVESDGKAILGPIDRRE